MKVKLIQIKQQYASKEIAGKDGKKFNIHSWDVIMEKEGKQKTTILKTFSDKVCKDIDSYIGNEIEVEEQDYQGNKSYILRAEKKQFTPGGRPPIKKVDWIQFETAVVNVYNLAEGLNKDKVELLFDKMMGCAAVILDFDTVPKILVEAGETPPEFKDNFNQDNSDLPEGVL